MVFFFLST
jgi:U3 small nucleolar RNA-associated protein 23